MELENKRQPQRLYWRKWKPGGGSNWPGNESKLNYLGNLRPGEKSGNSDRPVE